MSNVTTGLPLDRLGIDGATAARLEAGLAAIPADLPADERWRRASRDVVSPDLPFAVHRFVFDRVYEGWQPERGPAPAWLPDPGSIATSNIGVLMAKLGLKDYAALRAWAAEHRDRFWDTMCRTLRIRFHTHYHAVSGGTAEHPVWFPGARMNIAESCFDDRPDHVAVLSQKPGGAIESTTYGELDRLSNRVAGGLRKLGYGPRDPIAVDMPMTLESVAIYLGIVKLGGVVVSISDSFAPHEIAARLRIAGARAVFTQELTARSAGGSPLYERVAQAGAPQTIVVPVDAGRCRGRLRPGDLMWDDLVDASDRFEAVIMDPGDRSNILFSSGTTADPKAIPWSHTTPIKCAADAWLHHDVRPGNVLAWPTNLGWMMGPWLVYAALVNRAAIALYEGPPTGRAFGEFVRDAGVTLLGVIPSLVKAWRHTRCMEGLDWHRIRAFSSTGECSNADDMFYLMMRAGYKPVIEYCGGTEIGGGYITGTLVQPAAPATFTTAALGLDFVVLDESGQPTRNGEVYVVPPSIGLSTELLNQDHHAVYFEGTPAGPGNTVLRRHGDQVEVLPGGFYRHHGRSDDTMKLKGIKVSSAELERALNTVPGVKETAAVAVPPPGGGPARLVVYAVLSPGAVTEGPRLRTAMQAVLREQHGSLCKIHDVCVVELLPRTASNKVMRRVLRDRYRETHPGEGE